MTDETDRVPKGSYAAGRRVRLPAGARPPFVVFVNGVEQSEGARLRGRRRRDRLHPRDRQGEGRHRPLAGDVPGAVRHLPQGRDDRPAVPARRQDRADLRPGSGEGVPMELGFLLLADHSEAINGKVYMVGGGWNVLRLPELPHEWGFHITLGLDVGWDETNTSHDIAISVHDPDGHEVGDGLAGRVRGRPAAGDARRPGAAAGDVDRHHRQLRERRPARGGRPGRRRGDRPGPLLRHAPASRRFWSA